MNHLRLKLLTIPIALLAVSVLPGTSLGAGGQDEYKSFVKVDKLTENFQEYSHKLKAGNAYIIDLNSKAFDTFLYVKNADGKTLAQDDDGGQGLNSRLMFSPPEDGEYKIVVSSFGKNGRGEFRLEISSIKPALAKTGELKKTDPMDAVRKNSYSNTYSLKMKAGQAYVVSANSKEFDTYLRIENAKGESLEEDDDGGDRLNSKIIFRPDETGMYKIVVTSYLKATGKYGLTVLAPTLEELKAIDPVAALIGLPAPDFSAAFSFNGKTKKLSDLKGNVVLLDFWAVWCGPCKAVFPHLRKLAEEYKDDGLEVVGVTSYYKRFGFDADKAKLTQAKQLLTEKEENEMLKEFTKHYKLDYRIMALSNAEWGRAGNDYGVKGIPTAVVIDRKGIVRMIRVGSGEANAKAIESQIKRLLEQK